MVRFETKLTLADDEGTSDSSGMGHSVPMLVEFPSAKNRQANQIPGLNMNI